MSASRSVSIPELERELRELPALPDFDRRRVDLLNQIADLSSEHEQWDRMLELAAQARAIAQSIGYSPGIAYSLGLQAFAHYIRSDYRSALAECTEALRLASANREHEGRIWTVLALVNWSLGNFEDALRQVRRCMELLEPAGGDVSLGFAYATRGGILHSVGEYQQALECHQNAYDLFRAAEYTFGMGRALSGLGSAQLALGNLAEAQSCHQKSLTLAMSLDHRLAMSRALTDLGELCEAQGDDENALECHTKALEIRRKEGHLQAQTTSLLNLGRLYRKRGHRTDAIHSLEQGLAIADQIGARPKACQLHEVLSEIYEEAGELPEALRHFKACAAIRLILSRDQSSLRQKALQLESQLESVQKDAEIQRLRNVELARLLEQLRAMQAELVNSEKMAALGGLVAALAHEINSPLGVIRSSSDVTLRCSARLAAGAGPATLEILCTNVQLIADASQRLEKVVTRLKSFAGIDQAEYTQLDLVHALEDTIALIEPELGDRIAVPREYMPVPKIYCFAAELNQVFMNLLRNAVQAIDGAGSITVRVGADEKEIRVSFVDTGRGVPADHLPRLFNPGFNYRDRRVKASLSLFTCLSIVRKHGGDIRVESRPGEGSTFTIALPRSLEHAETRPEAALPARAS